jgi:hypothetical protein
MMREIEEQLLDAEEDVRLGKHAEFDQLAQEPANLQLGLDVDLVLLPNMPPAITVSVADPDPGSGACLTPESRTTESVMLAAQPFSSGH